MKIKSLPLLCSIVFFITTNLFAQEKVELSGQVKDEQTKDELEFCSVSVFNLHDSLIANSATDSKGFFTVSLKRGTYHFILHFIGYKNDTIQIVAVENKFLGVFKMEPTEKVLKELTVKTNSNENQLDRETQIVTDKLKVGASTTKDVLDKVNGVHVDKYSGAVKVDNNDKVIILVDGLEKDQEYIKNLSPDRLKKIEVIRDPGGSYALEGYSAVINIILKKDYRGTELFLENRTMADPDAVKSNYIPVQNNSSATYNYTYNKLNVYAKYSRNYNNFNLPSADKKEYTNGLVIEKNPTASDEMNTHVKQLFNNYTLGTDFNINPKHTVSFESNFANQPSNANHIDELYNMTFTKNGNLLNNYSGFTNTISNNNSSYNSFFYVGKLNAHNSLNSNFTFSTYKNVYSNLITQSTLYQRLENGSDKKQNSKFYFEYEHTFNAKSTLQIGYGNTYEQRNNIFTVNDSSNKFNYSDIRNKLYSYYSWQPNKKFGIKIGAAGETSSPVANGIKNSYVIFQPYADIRYNPAQLLDVKLKYRAGSTYPNIEQTNPFTYVIDQQSIKTGNPFLHPEVTHKISLQTVLAGAITIEPYYHFSDNYITQIGNLKNDSVFEYNYSNAGKYKRQGIESHFTIPFAKNVFLKTDMDFFKSRITYTDKINNINDWTMTNQLIYVNQKYGTVAVLEYQRNLYREITAEGYDMNGNDFWIFLVKQPFFKKKLEVMLLYFTPITLGVNFKQGTYIKTDNYTENKFGDISFLKNMFLLEVSYRFNKGKSVNKTEKNVEENKEKNSKSVF